MSEFPLSFTQDFLCAFDKGDESGSFGPRYHNTRGWLLHGPVDVPTLRAALADVVRRHEAIRTVMVRDAEPRVQRVLPAEQPDLVVHDLSSVAPQDRPARVEAFLNEVEAGTISVHRQPPLRAELGRFDDEESVLVLVAHHTVTDGWSMRVAMRDLAAFYAARREGGEADLPPMLQYREYAAWQRETMTPEVLDKAREYWRTQLAGAQFLGVPMDRPRSAEPKVTSTYRFVIDGELTSTTLKFASSMRSSPFMVLLAAYNLVLHRRTGATDIVAPTITSGRGQPQFENTIGAFFGFVPLRTDLSGCATLREVVQRSRTTALQAQVNEIPFPTVLGEAPDLMNVFAADDLAVGAIQVFQHPFVADGEMGGDLKYAEIRRRLLSQEVSADIPDGTLWTLDVDPADGIFGNVKFNRTEFDQATIAGMVDEFVTVLRRIVTSPDSAL
jgi:condensation enzyme